MSLDARAEAYRAVLHYLKTNSYIDNSLSAVRDPLARQIAYGTVQRLLSLDHLARQLAKRTSLSLKPAEKALLYTALYQLAFLTGSPPYAIVNEMVKLAKKECHPIFARFLNALLRAYTTQPATLPKGTDVHSLSLFYSYPEILIEHLLKDYGLERTREILDLGNRSAATMARLRTASEGSHLVINAPFPVITIHDPTAIAKSTDAYIQNVTPVLLMGRLASTIKQPRSILDLCAAPGGKLLLAHDLYPHAPLFANDSSEKRLERLRENLTKYQLQAHVTCMPAEEYSSADKFDLIILDVPCSNSGVLGKRPEARWRITEAFLKELELMQLRLIKRATALLAPHGVIWYLTCSVLKSENEQLIQRACAHFGLSAHQETTQFPTADGWDGGYACALSFDN